MPTLCGAVIARDEERNIERCLRSLSWADSRLVVVDDRTEDATASIAKRCGATVETRTFADFARQRNAALGAAPAEWVLFVDADEVVTDELAAEIRDVIACADAGAGYWIPRKNILFGHWVRHTGWSPDYQLRLVRRAAARYREDRTVHELVDLDGEAGHLKNPFVHYNYDTLRQFLAKQRTYASMQASDMFGRGIRVKPQNYLLQPSREFWRRYFALSGYRDGWLGFLLSTLLAYYELKTYLRLGALWKSAGRRPHLFRH
jgi:(heptosyl)LPS beta-1,4-glucosyltransferase